MRTKNSVNQLKAVDFGGREFDAVQTRDDRYNQEQEELNDHEKMIRVTSWYPRVPRGCNTEESWWRVSSSPFLHPRPALINNCLVLSHSYVRTLVNLKHVNHGYGISYL
jgi:hypothetical protein